MKRKIKHLIIGIKCLFGYHTEDPYAHIIYGNKKRNVCICCGKEFGNLVTVNHGAGNRPSHEDMSQWS